MSKIIAALIVASGSGVRFGGDTPKQYKSLLGKPVINYSLEKFQNNKLISHVCVVIARNHEEIFQNTFQNKVDYCFGGKERNDSVRLGLEHLQHIHPDFVLIHDAARPMIDDATINKIIQNLDEAHGIIVARKIVDTVKQTENDKILKTLPRQALMAAETPQAFNYSTIYSLHQKYKNQIFTDDSMLFEKENIPVKFIETDRKNIKITSEEDLIVAESIMRNK